ncbi:STAS domain-containing protein [Saccharothrix sp. MB29]|nr:STAS domain-containing protein [Saccharothrix sp. MB29]
MTVTTRVEPGDVAVVSVTGEVDLASEGVVDAAVQDQVDRRRPGLVVDLTRVDFFGSAGIRLLVDAAQRARRLGMALAVATDRRVVLRPLAITLVDQAVEIHPTVPAAVAALRGTGVPQRRLRA